MDITGNMRRIAVLMTCYNRVSTTLACLDALEMQRLPDGYTLDVYLVDDASPDGTGQAVKMRFPAVEVITAEGGLFWCRGMRLAWDVACSKGIEYSFFLWLNDDVSLKPDAIKSLLIDYEYVERNGIPESVIVGTFSSTEEEDDVSYCVSVQGKRCSPNGECPVLADGDLNGNLVLIPKCVFQKVGPIYNGYYHAFGDYDYSMMLRKKNVAIYASSKYSGVCPQQPERYYHLRDKSLIDRIRLLFNPKGYCIHDAYLYRYRRAGFLRACLSCIHVILVVMFAWERKR